jgi:trk system potassium uptake protein TrkH
MTWFDAVGHSFSTVAIGGFSTHDASIGFFDNSWVEIVCMIFMVISGVNFSLHFIAVRRMSAQPYAHDPEFKTYISLLIFVSSLVFLILMLHTELSFSKALKDSLFHTISIATTTGFSTENFAAWPIFLPALLLFTSFVGGCAGSTGGGLKVIRFLLLIKQGYREIRKLVHPNAIFKIRIGGKSLSNNIVEAIWGFFAAYVVLFVIFMLILMADGLNQVTAFSAVAACMNNLGPGLGDVAANYSSLSDLSKIVLSFAMLFGRLEIFTLLVLFTPEFWRS